MKKVIIIMGVSGAGKSTIGKLLSEDLKIPFFDGDDFHPAGNISKMAEGRALNDNDRKSWIAILNTLARTQLKTNSCVLVCSALKQKYRDQLSKDIQERSKWIYLSGSFELISRRLHKRKNHFMPAKLLKSQFDILEEPKEALKVDIALSCKEIINLIKSHVIEPSEFGLFGLGVMGKNLCRNLSRNGFRISMYNRHVDDAEEHIAENFKAEFNELSNAIAFDHIASFVKSLQQPRKIMLMVNAGKTIDLVIEDLLPYLSEGDILIDGGNSNYLKTEERFDFLKTKGIHFIGAGVSGGEEGALTGPSIMPSGDLEAYKKVEPFLDAIAAKDKNNVPCCIYIGPEGSGHFIKMVHNGIEYVEMQLIAEACTILEFLGKNLDEIANILETWKSTANSYLLQITIDILKKKEGDDWLVKKIVDKAANKGTGKWATIATSQLGVPSTMIASALFSRYISFFKEERIQLHRDFKQANSIDLDITTSMVLETYKFARIINHYQGFKLILEASNSYSWNINLSEIARIWTSGCIIKSTLMQELVGVLKDTNNVLRSNVFSKAILKCKPSIKKVVSECTLNDISVPCLGESIQFYNGITTANSSANIIQAQRDYFGAHTYRRVDDGGTQSHHSSWK